MKRFTWVAGALLLPLTRLAAGDSPAEVPHAVKVFLEKNCVGCHRSSDAPMGLDFTSLSFNLGDPDIFGRWVRIHDAIQQGAMPPGDQNVLNPADRVSYAKTIAEPLLAHERSRAAVEGRSVLRRLNRYEYENTLRDILGASWLQLRDSLPEDGIVQRFNKSGQALDVSHVQMARYLETADRAIRLVLASAREPQRQKRYYAREQKRFLNRMRYSEFNTAPERATIPILGFDAQPDVLAEKVPITVGAADPQKRELEAFVTPASTYTGNEYHFDGFTASAGGKYRLRFHGYSIWIHTLYEARRDGKTWWRPNREKTSRGRTTEPVTIYARSQGGEKRLLGSFDFSPEPAVHELEVDLLPGEQILPDAARLFRSRPGFTGSPDATAEGMPGVAYRWMEVTGPVASAESRRATLRLVSGPATDKHARYLLRSFLRAAYRRPPTAAELEKYFRIVHDRLSGGARAFEEAMIAGYAAVLCSPGFLYLEEEPGKLDSYALASRLSYFLWNTQPDPPLRRLAATGKILEPTVLMAETTRLLNHPKSRDFISAFLDYWLDLRKVSDTTPDQALYPDYYLDDLLLESALGETQQFFERLLRDNLPAANIVDSRFAMLNSHLARHYGLPDVDGVAIRRVELPPTSARGGLLTQVSVLKVTANGTTTSPVLRGAWICERILGDPLPPPPPGTPAIEPDTRGAVTIRQQLDKHRAISACAACHKKIDPPGFALESFDVLGGWRDRYRSTETGEPVTGLGKNGHAFAFRESQPVDASGNFEGESFQNIVEFKKLLIKDERRIARNLVKQFVAYGTGSPVSFGDRMEVERILDATAADRYRVRSLIENVIQSRLFTEK